MIVAIPAKDLIEQSEGEQELEARRIRARLDELIDHLGVNFPVWIVVTKVDLVPGFVEFFGQGIVHEADEGTPAHLWQLLMAGQVPLVLYFATVRLPEYPRQALGVLVLQAASALASFAAVFFLT